MTGSSRQTKRPPTHGLTRRRPKSNSWPWATTRTTPQEGETMCNDASFVLTNTNVFWSRNTSSHEEIIREFKLEHLDKHAAKIGLVRVEIVPPGDDFRLPQEQWIFRTDQDELPDWYDAVEAEQRVRAVLQYWIAACVVLPGQLLENVTAGRGGGGY